MLTICWQREYLEHCGIEQNFGCSSLARTPMVHKGDTDLIKSFQEFQKVRIASTSLYRKPAQEACAASLCSELVQRACAASL